MRHVDGCQRCQSDLNEQRSVLARLRSDSEDPTEEMMTGFSGQVLDRIERLTGTAGSIPSKLPRPTSLRSFQRYSLVIMLMIFTASALLRYIWVEEMLTGHELQRSIVTRDGRIVSEARLHGQEAEMTVVKDSSEMVIIWLRSSSGESNRSQRG